LGKISTALAIFIAGIVISRKLTRNIHANLRRRGNMSESAAAITEKLIHYFLLLIIILFAMRIVNIPLTVFAYLGGAVAIGVGFGAQKLLSNFISGFILMAEQPVKVGDLVQMNEQLGWIENIGVRATMVRTFSNIHILVPNSYFLENNIINWTHNDNNVRCEIRVGVAYGRLPIRCGICLSGRQATTAWFTPNRPPLSGFRISATTPSFSICSSG
jgi:potassium-dependent mechanosensitive channel